MIALLVTTFIWAFSFTLIAAFLRDLDSSFITSIRMALALLCLLPFVRVSKTGWRQGIELTTMGAFQFGLMYIFYIAAFRHIDAYLVALFSIFTPIWVTVIDGFIHRQMKYRALAAALLATLGALLLRSTHLPSEQFWYGFLLVQFANLAFAGGQVWFREWKKRNPETKEKEVFAFLYLGGLLLALAVVMASDGISSFKQTLTLQQYLVLLYLGIIASGLGFFLWNYGASRVPIGFLSAANNLVIPLGILVAFVSFDTRPEWPPFVAGTTIILVALLLGARGERKPIKE